MRFRCSLLSVLFSLSLLSTMLQAADDENPDIVILGDSLSAAYGMEVDQSWPSLLQRRLDEDGYAYRVFNSSITGDTTQSGLNRLPRLLEREPAVVIIELGGNDGLRGLPLEVTRQNLSSMIRHSQAAGATVLLAEMRLPPNYGATYIERFHRAYGELAREHGAILLPFLLEDIALDPGLMQEDGIHPNAAAQSVILDLVWAVLEPQLQ
ncbi:MAG: arylesterase [Xanthomonadales bacterium]|nr:arylesterase [Xanthomonadales bacterium]